MSEERHRVCVDGCGVRVHRGMSDVTGIIGLIDSAIWDTSESPDAMRWVPDAPPEAKTWRERLLSDAIMEQVLQRTRMRSR